VQSLTSDLGPLAISQHLIVFADPSRAMADIAMRGSGRTEPFRVTGRGAV
jgi:hypothetical protein